MAASGAANQIVVTQNVAFANSAAAGTAVDVDLAAEGGWEQNREHLLVVYNPSTVTALTVAVHSVETLGGGARSVQVETFAVPTNSSRAFVVRSLGYGETSRIRVTNDSVLGVADGFTAVVRVRRGAE